MVGVKSWRSCAIMQETSSFSAIINAFIWTASQEYILRMSHVSAETNFSVPSFHRLWRWRPSLKKGNISVTELRLCDIRLTQSPISVTRQAVFCNLFSRTAVWRRQRRRLTDSCVMCGDLWSCVGILTCYYWQGLPTRQEELGRLIHALTCSHSSKNKIDCMRGKLTNML